MKIFNENNQKMQFSYNVSPRDCQDFTEFDTLNTADDKSEYADLVCGIKIESDYTGGRIEQLNLYDVEIGSIFNFNGETEIKDITKNEVVISAGNNIQLTGVQTRPSEEENKVDVILKVNEFITGWSSPIPTPYRIRYKIKVMYVRKKVQLEY